MEKKLVEHLINHDVVSRKDIHRCALRAAMSEKSVVDEMLDRLPIDEKILAEAMADYWGLSYWSERSISSQPFALSLLNGEIAKKYGALPVNSDSRDETITLAVYDVEKAQAVIEKIRQKAGISPTLVVAPRTLVEREIHRQYSSNADEATPTGPVIAGGGAGQESSGQGVVHRRAARVKPQLKKQTGAGVDFSGRDNAHLEEPPPTRQVDLSSDNPFLDLVAQTGGGGERENRKEEALSRLEKATPAAAVMASPAVEVAQEEEDFFDGFDVLMQPSGEAKPSSAALKPAGGKKTFLPEVEPGGERKTLMEISEALDDFDAELEREEEQPLMTARSSIDWGDAASGSEFERSHSGSGALNRNQSGSGALGGRWKEPLDPYDVEGSGIFPLEPEGRGLLSGMESESQQELTLAEVVERQSKLIEKLEREIEYQKGILQTMAELLIEARVLSRRKLKNRLKALKTEQKKKVDS